MKTKVLIFLIFTISVFAIGTLITVLFNTAPTSRDVIALFYLALFASIFGVAFFINYGFNYLKFQALPSWNSTAGALRLSTVISVLGCVMLSVRSVKLLNWITFVILIILAVAAELILRRRSIKSS